MIDVQATNARFDERCISRSKWARSKYINPATFYHQLHGRQKMPDATVALLKEDDLLVDQTTKEN